MSHSRLFQRTASILTLVVLSYWIQGTTRADVFQLAGGGRLEGKLLPADDASKLNCTIELSAGGRVTIARSQIAKIETVTDGTAEYQKLARTSPDTVDAHWQLSEWCR